MAPSNPRADWERLGDQFFQKVRIYDGVFDEDLELENYVIAAAPYAGALGKASTLLLFSMKERLIFDILMKHSIGVKARSIGIGMHKQQKRV